MNGTQIITKFELQVSDITELSSSEELGVLNRVYHFICTSRPWEILKKTATGSISTDATGSYITLPADFYHLAENLAGSKVVFTGSNLVQNTVVNFSDRRSYANLAGYAYLDIVNSKIRFTTAPVDTTYEFDYIRIPDDITTSTSSVFPTAYDDLLVFGMAVDNEILQLSPKAKSYMLENQTKFNSLLANMESWNSHLQVI